LQGTTTGDKNEILWQHGINYQSLPEQFKKVSFWMSEFVSAPCYVHALWHICNGLQLQTILQCDAVFDVAYGRHCWVHLQGTVITRHKQAQVVKQKPDGTLVERMVMTPVLSHIDIIADAFWEANPDTLQWVISLLAQRYTPANIALLQMKPASNLPLILISTQTHRRAIWRLK